MNLDSSRHPLFRPYRTAREQERAAIEEQERIRRETIERDRMLREEQDRAYEESVRMDIEKIENARLVAEAASRAAAAAEETARALQAARLAEEARKASIVPPVLRYAIETIRPEDLLTLRFRLPNGSVVNHAFHYDEPLESILQQLRYDLKYLGDLVLTLQPRTVITCSPDTSISTCGITNRSTIVVTYP